MKGLKLQENIPLSNVDGNTERKFSSVSGKSIPYESKVINSLMLQHLESQGFSCSLSVFLPESGMKGYELPLADILQVGFLKIIT